MSQEGISRRSDERDSYMSMWITYEWFDFGKENSPTRVLLAEYRKGLYPNS